MAQFKLHGRKAKIIQAWNRYPELLVMEFCNEEPIITKSRIEEVKHITIEYKEDRKRITKVPPLFCIRCNQTTPHNKVGTTRRCGICNERYFKGIKSPLILLP